MKKVLVLICLFIVFGILKGQEGKVIDIISKAPLEGVLVIDNKNSSVITNEKGLFNASVFKNSDSITFKMIGYKTRILTYQELERMNFVVKLEEKILQLEEVVISANKFNEERREVPAQMLLLKGRQIESLNQPTTADLLQQSGLVLVQKSQLGGGSPILRGFEANKVLLVVDGIRMNNAIYRGGHLQNIITVDNNALDRIEVIYGPGSVVYGSDALGGVIHMYTKNPILSTKSDKPLIKLSTLTRYSTAANEKTNSFTMNVGLKKVAFLTTMSLSDFDDLRQGNIRNPFYSNFGKRYWYVKNIDGKDSIIKNDNPNIQKYSGYTQYDMMYKLLFAQNNRIKHLLNVQYSNSSNVPRYDRLTQEQNNKPRFAEWYYGPQKRFLSAYTFSNSLDTGFLYNDARITLSYQQIEESRHDRRFRKNFLNSRIENLDIVALNADFEKKLNKNELRYGIDVSHNLIESKAFKTDIYADTVGKLDTRYPDGGSAMTMGALYATHKTKIGEKFIITEGARLNYTLLKSKFNDTTFFPFPFKEVEQKHTALSASAGFVYFPGQGWRISSSNSTGFRAPNLDDMAKVFESVPGKLVVPNPDLKPEYTYNTEISIGKEFEQKTWIEVIGWHTWYRNVITLANAKFRGQDSIFYNGMMSKVISNKNEGKAFLYGGSFILNSQLSENVYLNSSLTYTYGRILTDTTKYPLDHIPPVYGRTGLKLKQKFFEGEIFVLYNGWKYKKDYNMIGEDNFAFATPHGMPAWYTLNLDAIFHLNRFAKLQVRLENIFDQNYRVFASNISAPGRNLILSLRLNM